MKTYKILTACMLLNTFALSAQTLNDCDFSESETFVYHINGMATPFLLASYANATIKKAYTSTYPNTEFALNYNYSSTPLTDIAAVIGMLMAENQENFNLTGISYKSYRALYTYLVKAIQAGQILLDNTTQWITEGGGIPADVFQNTVIRQLIEEFLVVENMTNANLNSHLSIYQKNLDQGDRVILIPHSQGNFFANYAMKNLSENYYHNIASIGLGNPAGIEYGNSRYYTDKNDLVINLLRLMYSVLPANIDNSTSSNYNPFLRDPSSHLFLGFYFHKGFNTRQVIDSDLQMLHNDLNYPKQNLIKSAIEMTSNFAGDKGVQLKTLDPSENEILAISDFGNQKVNLSCDTLKQGKYTNYLTYERKKLLPYTLKTNIKTIKGDFKEFSTIAWPHFGFLKKTKTALVGRIEVINTSDNEIQYKIY